MKNEITIGRTAVTPYMLFLLVLVLIPLGLVVYYSFTDTEGGFTFAHFLQFMQGGEALNTFLYSFFIAMVTTAICLLLGYPAAYFLSIRVANNPPEKRLAEVMIILYIVPMWINCLLRTLATVELFNILSIPLGEGALLFGLCYDYLPFMIYPIYTDLLKMDMSLLEASADLGANRWQSFWKVVVPLSKRGIYSGIVMVFLPTLSTFAISELLTHNKITLFGSLIQRCFGEGGILMWNYGAALSMIMFVVVFLLEHFSHDEE
jgi:spermidine/putrescine transport system permease protein